MVVSIYIASPSDLAHGHAQFRKSKKKETADAKRRKIFVASVFSRLLLSLWSFVVVCFGADLLSPEIFYRQ
jgi:hypothetical protein